MLQPLHQAKVPHQLLDGLLGSIGRQQFFDNFFGKAPLALPGTASRFVGAINWPLLAEIFLSGHDNIWFPRLGALPEGQVPGRRSFDEAVEAFCGGRTILIRHAELCHPVLADIADNFFDSFTRDIDVQLYATPAGEEGFGWHYDIEDVFVIQSVGKKEFLIRENTVNPKPGKGPLPRCLHFERETTKTQLRCLLHAGDWLYIPAGFWHKARAVENSFHLSIGVAP